MKIGKFNPRLLCYMSAVALSVAGCSQHTTKTKPSPVTLSNDQTDQPVSHIPSSHSEARLFHNSKKGVRQVNVSDTNRTKRVQYEYANLWERLFDSYSLPDVQNSAVEREVSWFVNHPTYLQRAQQRAEPFLYNIVQQVERQGVPGELALLPVVESAFQAQAVSPAKAAGIWQFIPTTGRNYGLKQNHAYDGRRDVYASTKAAIKYLKKLNRQFNGDWLLSIAAYNCGEGAVERAIRRNAYQGLPTDFWSLDLPQETRSYVPRLLAVSRLFSDADRYGLDLRHIPNEAMFKTVKVSHQLDLVAAADAADMSLEAFRAVNPGFKHTFVDPDGSVRLFVPAHKSKTFKKELARMASVQGDLLRREFEIRQNEPDTSRENFGAYTSSSPSAAVPTAAGSDTRAPRVSPGSPALHAALRDSSGEPTRTTGYSPPPAAISHQDFDASANPFQPSSFSDSGTEEPAATDAGSNDGRRSSHRVSHRGSSVTTKSTRGNADRSESASRGHSKSTSKHRSSESGASSQRAEKPAAKSSHGSSRSTSATGRHEATKSTGKLASSNVSATATKSAKSRGSALASPQKSSGSSKGSDSKKSYEKIVTAKAETTRPKTRR